MRRIFTSTIFATALLVVSFNSFAQTCGTGGAFATAASYNFASNSQQFTGDLSWTNAGGGELISSDLSAGTIKNLTSPTFFQPASSNTIYWEFDLGGSANVTSYSVDVIYYNGSYQTVNACSGGAIANGNNLIFNASAPSAILGKPFKLSITFVISGASANQSKILDNFRTNAQISNIALPVKFSSLNARMANNSVSLKWNVATEDNVNGYEIERSADGRNYSKIGFVNADGQSTYSFVDTKTLSIAYYRIKSVDINGKYGYSTVAMVKAGKAMIVIKAFPTPFIKNVSIQHPTAVAGSAISISSEDGRIVKTIVPAIGTQQTDIDLSSSKAGLYLVRYSNGSGETETLKILKQQ